MTSAIKNNAVLHGQDIEFSIGKTTILRGLAVEIYEGEMFGIVGPNGSGKSTLLRILGGLLPASNGTVHLNGTLISELTRKQVARNLALVEQHAVAHTELSVRDVIGLGRIPYTSAFGGLAAHDQQIIDRVALETGVTHLLNRLFSTLSGGEQQRVHIARALAQETPLLFLDEPTNHLDISHQLSLLELAASSGRTTVVVLHDLNLASMFCQRVLILNQGRAHAIGTPESVLSERNIAEVFDVSTRVHSDQSDPYIQFLRNRAPRESPLM